MPNPVALVTGASSGIGAEFARQLAADGFDLVLVARRADRLEELRRTITGRSTARVHTVVRDLSQPDAARAVFDETEARGLAIEWLVNNAGFGTNAAFADLPLERELEQIQVNVAVPVALARLYLPGMLRCGRGQIINLGSVGSFAPSPYMATYGGTKAFILSFTEALAGELAGTPVGVMVLCPGATRTEFQTVAGVTGLPDYTFMAADVVVRQAIAAAKRGKRTLVPGVMNKATVASTRFAPRRLITWITGLMMKPPAGGRGA